MTIVDDTIQSVLIIGNGFDLNLGLKTSYNDFLNSTNFDLLKNSNNHLANHLIKKHSLQNWIDIENELKNYSKNAKTVESRNYKNDFISLSNTLKDFLNDVKYDNLNTNSESYKLIEKITNDNFVIYDFNYTNTIKKILLKNGFSDGEINQKLIKVHGSIEDKQIIFGVEDNADIKADHIFIKKAFKNNKPVNLYDKIQNVNDIYIFGHSLGETDHTYFNRFFDDICSINGGVNDKKIFLYYYGEDGYENLHRQLDRLTNYRLTIFKQGDKFNPINTLK